MSFLKNLFGKGDGVPNWVKPTPPVLWHRFRELVEQALTESGLRYLPDYEEGAIELPDDQYTLGLYNVWMQFANGDAADRDELVRAHFDRVLESIKSPRPIEPFDADLDRLRIRIYDHETVLAGGRSLEDVVGKPLSPLTMATIVVDVGNAARSIGTEELAASEHPFDELYERALANTLRFESIEVRRSTLGDTLPCTILAESFYCTTALLYLDHFIIPKPTGRVFAVIPNRDMLVWAEADPGREDSVIQELGGFARYVFRQAGGPISTEIFEWIESGPVPIARA